MENKEIFIELKKPMDYHWKIQSYNGDKTKASCVAYIDARDVMNRLDDVVWPENWKDEYYEAYNRLMCKLSIKIDWEWISKCDTGAEEKTEKEKSLVSDAFKRAAVKWWIWRFLYDLEIKWIGWNESNKKPVDEYWKPIYNLTEYFNKGNSSPSHVVTKEGIQEAKNYAKSVANKPWFNEHEFNEFVIEYKVWIENWDITYDEVIEAIQSKNLISQKMKDKIKTLFN